MTITIKGGVPIVAALFLSIAVWGGIRGLAYLSFLQDCSGHLKRAADART